MRCSVKCLCHSNNSVTRGRGYTNRVVWFRKGS